MQRHHSSLIVLQLFVSVASILFLSACGGGSGGSSGGGYSAAAIPNEPPVFAIPSQKSFLEGAPGLTLVAIDANDDNIVFSIIGGPDKDSFFIANSKVLAFVTESDYENPGDIDANNEYLVKVQAFDGLATTTADLTIKILDALEGRVIDGPISGASIFVDLDGDRIVDSGEPTGTTNENGYFKVPQITPIENIIPKIISYEGIDSKTGQSLAQFAVLSDVPGPLVCDAENCAKPDSAFITPLTSLLATTTNDEDKEKILSAFGISDSPENLLSTDIWKSAEAGSNTSKNIQRINQQIALLLQAVNTISGVNDLANSLLVVNTMSSELLSLTNSQDTINLTKRETVESLLKKVTETAFPTITISESTLEKLVVPVANINAVFADLRVNPVGSTMIGVVSAAQSGLRTSMASFISGEISVNDFSEKNAAKTLFGEVTVPTDASDYDEDGLADIIDFDDDNDGVQDYSDEYPLNSNVHTSPVAIAATHQLRLQPVAQTKQTIVLTGTAQNNRSLTYSLVSDGSYGTASINSTTGVLTYTPSVSTTNSITDTITFKVNDGYISSSVSTVTLEIKTDPLYRYQWHLDNTKQSNFSAAGGFLGEDLNVDSVISAGVTGDTVTVAILDTGLEIAHEDLAANIVAGKSWDYVDSDTDPTSDDNDGDHGTTVAGIVASVGWNKIGGRGVAPDVSLVGYNFLESPSIANEVHAMGLDNDLASNVDIFNMSYGRNNPTSFQLGGANNLRLSAFVNGVTNMRSGKGAIYVQSAGNTWYKSGYCGPNSQSSDNLACTDSVFDPAFALPYVIGVAALNAKGLRSSYSTPGASIWISGFGGEFGIYAPAIMSVDQSSCSSGYVKNGNTGRNAFDNQGYHAENSNCNYMSQFNGTSSAAPTVAGVIALMLEANPNLTWRDVKKILASTARQVDNPRNVSVNGIEQFSWITNAAGYKFHNWYGFGVIDAAAAVSSAKAYTPNNLGAFVETDWNSSATVTATMVDSTTHYIDVPITAPAGSSDVIEFVRLRISLRHTIPNSIGIRLQSPSGTVSTILQPYTRLQSNPNADCSISATCTYFELASNAFYGEPIAGTWRLLITDHISDGTQGIFEKYQINIYGH